MIFEIILFILHGFLGGALYIFMWKIHERDEMIRVLAISSIAGYIYFWLHSEYNYPNAIMSIVFAYFAPDFLEAVLEKLKAKL